MKSFFKYVFATIVGLAIFCALQVVVFFMFVGAMAAFSNPTTTVSPNSVFELNLKGQLVERGEDNFSAMLTSFVDSSVSEIALDDILKGIDCAANNSNISGIYLEISSFSASPASVQEIRSALEKFKKSGKFIVAYANNYGNGTYYIASVADKILLNPQGIVGLQGMSSSSIFFKNLLDKIGVKIQVFKVGTFKSAVEPYIDTKMSDANRLQMTQLTSSIWNNMVQSIAQSREISVDKINSFANDGKFLDKAEVAIEFGLVDSLVYADEVKNIIENFAAKDYKSITLNKIKNVPVKEKTVADKIAVLYAVGEIDGSDSNNGINSEKIAKELIKLAEKDEVKAVVLRVNSPGGSAFGSEQIWHAAEVLRAKKPFVVSMGDYAASGGYYISCAAQTIVAEPNTLTGSIGIFGLFPDAQGLFNKIGVNFDNVKTNKFGDLGDISRPMTDLEKTLVQRMIENGYELFVKRCADGRNLSVDSIKTLAQGRVYSGTDALKIGLVDKLGTLEDAIAEAAQIADLTDYQLSYYPAKKDFMSQILESVSTDFETKILKNRLGENYQYYQTIQNSQQRFGVQAFMPWEIVVE
jgi:protease-4